jgi:hypothetical protein
MVQRGPDVTGAQGKQGAPVLWEPGHLVTDKVERCGTQGYATIPAPSLGGRGAHLQIAEQGCMPKAGSNQLVQVCEQRYLAATDMLHQLVLNSLLPQRTLLISCFKICTT